MKLDRRHFLQSGAFAGAAQSQAPAKPLLVTSGASALAQTLADGLQDKYRIRLTERAPVRTRHEFVECALGHDPATNAAVRGAEAIVHVAEPLPGDSPEQQLDLLTRCTYNLLFAAAQEAVQRVVLLSTLDVMAGYPPEFTVAETWQPRPGFEPRVLAKHLGEFTCREFARDNKANVVVLRLGRVGAAAQGQPPDPLWLDERDAVQAVSSALAAKIGPWQIFHILSESPRARFSVTRAKKALGYQPRSGGKE